MEDLDGSLTGTVGAVVVSATNMTAGDVRCSTSNSYLNGSVCIQTTDWIRFAFKDANPYPPVFVNFEKHLRQYCQLNFELTINLSSFLKL